MADQIIDWVYQKKITNLDRMSNISKEDRTALNEILYFKTMKVEELKRDRDRSEKFLFKLEDGNYIESVVMNYENRISACLSTQVGCRFKCSFCASGKGGFIRNLTVGEITEQLFHIVCRSNRKVKNIVFMGIGEPLDNYDHVVDSIDILSHFKTFNIGKRKITVSTAGIPEMISKLAATRHNVKLAVSLHAPTDALRKKLMPGASVYSIEELLNACTKYKDRTKKRVTLEYVLIDGVNDNDSNAYKLAKMIAHSGFFVNLIPYNEIPECQFKTSTRVQAFKKILRDYGITVEVRDSKGKDIGGACGQLRIGKMKKDGTKK